MKKVVKEFFERNNISYEFNINFHNVNIDFKIGNLYFIVKPSEWFSDILASDILKLCRMYHIIIITNNEASKNFGKPNSLESNGLKYLHKCPLPLIGVDIDLFNNPRFPYKNDRPPCFYDVKVDGQKSSHEAFFDEKIRWEMIVNRIQYSGGFIDSNQILSALNITRTCKQPSWFSKTFAKNIIKEYCTSNIIVDPFAGWGTRYDAAIELGRKYVGGDFNPELVEWHNNVMHRNILLCDANNFSYEGNCSVFICPPYSDPKTGRCFEDYNFDNFDTVAKQKSQCDWLKIVMKNIPNANEYIMVCKVVDEGWDKYIVDTKTNKSHFGKNNEYILKITNETF